MAQIDREGTYRGHAAEVAVNTTKNGFPQLVLRFAADELYDPETDQWVPWEEYEQDIIGYFVLFGGTGKCLNFEQVQKALGWDGASFADLDRLEDLDTRSFQLRVEWDEYNGVKSLKAVWIDAADASPGSAGLKKIDTTALKALDAQYGGQLGAKKVTPKKVTPKKAPKGKPVAPPKTKAPPKKKAETVYPPDEEPTEPEAEEPKAAIPPPPAKRGKKAEKGGGLPTACSREEAWAEILELKMASVTDDRLSEAWVAAIDKIVGEDMDGDDVSKDQWAAIRDEVLNTIPSILF